VAGERTPIEILEAGLGRVRVLVVGDLILDQTFTGTVGRISPEAPIPVVKVESKKNGLGGAGNVANNLSRLGCRVAMASAVGMDHDARLLQEMLTEKGIAADFLVETRRPSTKKLRIVSARQQMLRLDFERTDPIEPAEERELLANIVFCLEEGVDAVVLSDYGKGVCTGGLCRTVIGLCFDRKIPVLVDPKGADWERYRGCTLVTPNLSELGEAAHRVIPNENEEIEKAAGELMERFGVENILVTRSDRGMSLVSEGEVFHEKALAREVFDVSGAGDTVVAVLAAFLSGGVSLRDAAHAANRAAGFVVGKTGTYAIGREELLAELRQGSLPVSSSKVVPLHEALSRVGVWKAEEKRVVFTNGCFDILHAGHVHCLEKAKSFGDRLVVGLNSDSSVRRLKGPDRPLNAEAFRAMVLAALSTVDLVVLFEEETPLNLIRAVKPDVLVKGGDYRLQDIVGGEETASWGGKVIVVPSFEGLSTTGILEAFSSGDSEKKEGKRSTGGEVPQ
jgi:D-beta-D-heptose 7-phosphate kinase/D-beta-D-heptose 1-phosphate adenosyltransferase